MNNIKNSDLVNIGLSNPATMSSLHFHDSAQLSFTIEGIIRVKINRQLFIIPPNMAIYVPPNYEHKTEMQKAIKIEHIYFGEEYLDFLPTEPRLIYLSELAKQVIFKICSFGLNRDPHAKLKNLFTVLLDEINSGDHVDYTIKVPNDPRILKVYDLFFSCKGSFPSLTQAAECACVNIRTLTRLFIKDTGVSFVTWKQQFIFARALELLQHHRQTTIVAYQLGYNSESAFIAMFKKMSGGKTPSSFWRDENYARYR